MAFRMETINLFKIDHDQEDPCKADSVMHHQLRRVHLGLETHMFHPHRLDSRWLLHEVVRRLDLEQAYRDPRVQEDCLDDHPELLIRVEMALGMGSRMGPGRRDYRIRLDLHLASSLEEV